MPHDQPYLQAENKIEEALKSGAMKLVIRHLLIRLEKQYVENKGGYYGA